jgi:hypothetical protein
VSTSIVPVKLPTVNGFYRRRAQPTQFRRAELADVVEVNPEHARVVMEDALTGERFHVALADFDKDWAFVWKPTDEDPRDDPVR